MSTLQLKSYAKINLGLRVLKKRADGFHEIETIYQMVDLHDLLKFESAEEEIEIESDHPSLPKGRDNLCFRACDLLRKKVGRELGVRIFISKRIPIGGGLGGGSSNAATTLKGLNFLWNLNLPYEELFKIATNLGSDVPFFLKGGTAFAKGRGQILKPMKLPFDFCCVIVYPNIEISTRWAYENLKFDLTNSKKSIKLKEILEDNFSLSNLQEYLTNDLEEVVFEKYPQLQAIKREFYSRGAIFSAMSGSGSCIYGLYRDKKGAARGFEHFKDRFITFITTPIFEVLESRNHYHLLGREK